jgi:hypothetical protein
VGFSIRKEPVTAAGVMISGWYFQVLGLPAGGVLVAHAVGDAFASLSSMTRAASRRMPVTLIAAPA